MKSRFSFFSISNSNIRNWICLICYVVIIHILYLKYYEAAFEFSYEGNLFIFNFNREKYLFCLLETLIISKVTIRNMMDMSLTAITLVFLNYLYFIPGIVQQAVTNEPWAYMLFFFAFWSMMEFWLYKLPAHTYSRLGCKLSKINKERYLFYTSFFAIILAHVLMVYHGKSFSISNFQETLLDVYGVRAEATLAGTHWIIVNIETWTAYFIVLATGYYSYLRKWALVVFLVIAEIAVFLIAANRIFLFFEIAAIIVGSFHITAKKMNVLMVLIAMILLVEVNIIDFGLVVNDVFRRFAIVPNRISGFYFDYFSTHSPDYLRSLYDRTFSLIGLHSYYADHSISRIIGDVYFGRVVGCNTGLVGGSMFCFGFFSLIFSTFGYIMALRIFEGAIYQFEKPYITLLLAIILGSLSINTYALLANLFNTSYFLLLYLSIIPLGIKTVKTNNTH